jgi:DNA invertase Pin-like site-specific DNA recombinase
MIETKTSAKRKVRDAKIFELYNKYRFQGGAKREITAETIAKETKCSVTTVKRITKNIEYNFINGICAG